MKKLIIVLMVVAVASFLFVGCVPTAPVTPVTPTEPTVSTVKTATPYITAIGGTNIASALTQYTSAPTVTGVGVAAAIIRVYIDGVMTGIGTTGVAGLFGPISVSMVTLTEGVKVLHVTATQPGLTESDASTKYTFTFDETAPTLASAIADSSDQTITVTFNEDVNMAGPTSTVWAASALNFANWTLNDGTTVVTLGTTYLFTKVSDKVVKITTPAALTITLGNIYTLGVIDVTDKADNDIKVRSYVSCIGTP